MLLKILRYAHLALAIISSVFLIIVSVTGVILAVDAAYEKSYPYKAENFDEIALSETISVLKDKYLEVFSIQVDHNQFVNIEAIDENGSEIQAIIQPLTGEVLSKPLVKNNFVQWNIGLHRSLFLKDTGRFIVGIVSFLLLLIVISGLFLIIQRQKSLFRFFSKINKDFLAQYYHVVAGRVFLIPLFIIALTGTYLFLERFDFLPSSERVSKVYEEEETVEDVLLISELAFFNQTKLRDVLKVEFPFSEDIDEKYTIYLKDRAVAISQFSGKILEETIYPTTQNWKELSFRLHTGETNWIWALILGLSALNILFFIVSGTIIFWKRISVRVKNTYSASEAEYIVFVGSENGSTMHFAHKIHQQLLSNGEKSRIEEMNHFSQYDNARHFIIMTSTYGLGDAPNNASRFIGLVDKYQTEQKIKFSVVGFGSKSYKEFCAFGQEVDTLLAQQSWAQRSVQFHTIHDKSLKEFTDWVTIWSGKSQIPLISSPEYYRDKSSKLTSFKVDFKTEISESNDVFELMLKPQSKIDFQSGDLFVIQTKNQQERFYSISKIDGKVLLIVKWHEFGLGSNYLYQLQVGENFKAKIIRNSNFYFPQKTSRVLMISNGTGIAPFLGMIAENTNQIETHIYAGFRYGNEATKGYKEFFEKHQIKNHLFRYEFSFSKECDCCYVVDLLLRDRNFIANALQANGVIMICGSLAMYNDVKKLLADICTNELNRSFDDLKSCNQILVDCY